MLEQAETVLAEPGRFAVRRTSLADPGPGKARLRVRRIGICGTDIHAFHGHQPFFAYPRVLGHELAGEVVAVNGATDLKPGDLVAVEPYLNDPASPASRKGRPNCCESLRVLGVHCDGGMRPELNVPLAKLHRSASASAEQLALVEMLCIGRHAANRARVESRESVLVLGAGPIGLATLVFLRELAPRLAVADLDERRLAFCREALGITETYRVGSEEGLAAFLDARLGGAPDLVFDATGNRASMLSTFRLCAHGGRIVFVGLFQGEIVFDDPGFHRRELTLMSSRNATPTDFAEVIGAIEAGRIDTDPWITHRLGLGEVPERFASVVADPSLRKAVVEL